VGCLAEPLDFLYEYSYKKSYTTDFFIRIFSEMPHGYYIFR